MKKKIITLLLAIFITISSIVPAVAMEQTTSDKTSNEKTSVNNVGNKENKILPNGEKGIKSKEEKDSNKLEKETKQKSNEKNSKEKEFNLLKEAKNVQMRPVKTHDDVIKKITVKSESGGPLGTVVQWQTVKVDMDFELPDHQVKEGDTTTIKLPDALVFVSTPAEFDVKDPQGNIVAKAKVDANQKTVTLTYTNYPETHSGVKGSLFFYSRIDHVKFKEKKKIDLNFKIGNKHISGGSIDWDGQGKPNGDYLQKASWKSSINGNVISYAVFINRKGQEIKKGWLEDTLDGEKVEYLKNEFRVVKGNWQWSGDQGDYELKNEVDITNKVKVEWHPNGKSFKLNFGDLSATEGITVYYKVKIGYTPIDGEVFKNKVKLTGEKIQERDAHNDYRYFTAGGKAEGYVYSIKIKKEGEKGESLKGAKFKLTRDRNNAVVGEYVTNEQGEIEIKDLLKDDYTLVEIQAPKGYKLDNKEIKIKPDDFGKNKVAFKTITNKKERISIPVEKVWKGKALEKVEVTLKADGVVKEQVELSKTNNWKHTFENLDKYKDDGTLINYTIEEKAVLGYKTEIVQKDSNDITKGFVITNKETPKWTPMIPPTRNVKITKEWLGTDGSKITAPVDKIEVELYRDGKATGQKLELNKANNWTGEFKDLKAYESILNSKPYEYTIKEVGESNNSIKFDGKWFKVIYSGNMKDGIKVENKETPKWTPMIPPTRNVKITKEWLGTDGSKITAPVDKIEVELYRDGKATGQKLELNKANNWTGEFKDLKAYESILNSKPYEYTIKEVGESNNSIKFDGKWFKVIYSGNMKDGIKVENKETPKWTPMIPPTRNVKITKEWLGTDGSKITAPVDKIEVELYRDGKATGQKLELNKANNWTGEFKDLKAYESILNSKPYEYTIKEVGESNNSIKFDGKWFKVIYSGNMKDGIKVENKETPKWTPMIPPTRNVKITKEWLGTDGSKITAPVDKIEVELYRDGKATGQKLELNKANNWTGEFKDLKAYESILNSKPYEYTIKEVGESNNSIKFDGKWFKVIYSGNMKDGIKVENKETPKWTPMIPPTRNVKITKEWLGTDGSKITAPVDKIEVELYRDGKATGQKLELNKANNWTGEFKDLKAYESILNSKPYEYTIKEVGESNNSIKFDGKWFKVIYSGNMKDGIKVENKETPKWTPMIPPTRNVKITKEWLGTDGSKITAPVDKIEVELYRDGKATGQKLELNKANNWTGEFKDLKAYESILNSKPYEYTIKEVGESNNSIKFDGKWFKVIYSGNMKDGIKVTNTLIPTTPPPMPPKKPKLPKTGIGINTLIYAGISSISGGIILLFLRKRKVKNEIDV